MTISPGVLHSGLLSTFGRDRGDAVPWSCASGLSVIWPVPWVRALQEIFLQPTYLAHCWAIQHPLREGGVGSKLVHRQLDTRALVVQEECVRITYRVLRSHCPCLAIKQLIYLPAIVPKGLASSVF